jgi:iron complex outermembrane recepter protein
MRRISVVPFLSLAAGSLFAQEDAVVVSATRVPQPSLEIPASIDRIYGEEIREGRPQVNLSESLGRVPGISVQNRQNYAQDLQIQSRGFGARSTFGVRGIRLYADGIPATMPDGQGQAANFALGSAESIEVLRGPFSSMYGSSSGGVISVQTEDGPQTPTAEAGYLLGSYGTRRGELKAGGQWGALNAIADLTRFKTDGYRDHSAAIRDQFNAKLRYGLSQDTSLTLVTNSLRQPQTQDPGGLTKVQVEQNPRQVQPTALTFNTRKTVFQEQSGLVLNHHLDGGAQIQAVGYYGERWQEQYLGLNANGVVNIDRGFGGGALRYSNPLSETVKVSLGTEYDLMHDRRKGFNNVNGVQGALTRNEDNEAWSTGIYAQGEWKFAERWSAHAGARYTRVAFRNTDYFLADGDGSGDRAYSATTPVAGLVFRANPTTSLYANVGRGFETPTFLELANRSGGASGLNFALDASTSRHAELGAKTIVPGYVRLNAAAFDIVTSNEIVVDQNVNGRASFKNVGHTDRRGFELAAESAGTGPVEARIAYTYLKAVYQESFSTQILTAGPQVSVAAGSQIAGVPRSTLYGELRYHREPFFAQLEGLRKSRVPVNDPNSEFADGYLTMNVATGLVQQDSRWRVTEFVRVDNLTGKNYVGSVIVNEGNGRYYEPSPRRNMTLGAQASLRF